MVKDATIRTYLRRQLEQDHTARLAAVYKNLYDSDIKSLIEAASKIMCRYTLAGFNRVIYDTSEFEQIFDALVTVNGLKE